MTKLSVVIDTKHQLSFDPSYGAIYSNSKTKPSHPDLRGQARLPDGQLVEVSAWRRTTKNGKPYLSLSILNVIDVAEPDDDFVATLTGLLPE
ncbi:hypothetical protein [Shewanella sp. UCD-KL21]|uniref:hypothetical protein n=1 Tax=Shewanella sp. UCD-KL21 TaxID=1917164 RepID=UPI000970E84F|nr:hypothetical protein [Shewanella sp. UCD-KL21]